MEDDIVNSVLENTDCIYCGNEKCVQHNGHGVCNYSCKYHNQKHRGYHEGITHKKVQKMSEKWLDLNIDGRRLNRIIRLLETNLKKEEDVDKMMRFANSITYVTSKKIELAYKILDLKDIVAKVKAREKKREAYGR